MTVLEKVQDLVKAASDKTSEMIEISRLRAGIAEDRREITGQEAKLGAVYYELYKNGEVLTPDAVNVCADIDKLQSRLAEKEEALNKINEAIAAKKAAKESNACEETACPECGTPNPSGAKFCSECGAKIPVIVDADAVEVTEEPARAVCPDCGAELRPDQKFCNECGTKIN